MPSDNIAKFPAQQEMTTPEMALADATARGLTDVLILGYTPEGALFIRSSGDVTRKEALWLLECARTHVMTGEDE